VAHDRGVPDDPVVRELFAAEVARYRDLRLEALLRDPTAFTATWDDEQQMPLSAWEARVASSAAGTSVIAVAEAADELVGLAVGVPWNGRARVVSVWVEAPWRGRGLASRLIDHVCAWAARAGFAEAQIETAVGNPGPRALYERLRFLPTDEPPPPGAEHVLVRALQDPATTR